MLVENYLPTDFQKYMLQNYKQMSTYTTYDEFALDFLRGGWGGGIGLETPWSWENGKDQYRSFSKNSAK